MKKCCAGRFAIFCIVRSYAKTASFSRPKISVFFQNFRIFFARRPFYFLGPPLGRSFPRASGEANLDTKSQNSEIISQLEIPDLARSRQTSPNLSPDLRSQIPDLARSRQTSPNLSPDLRSRSQTSPDLARPRQISPDLARSRQTSDPDPRSRPQIPPTNISVLLAIHRPDICWLVLAVGSLRPPYLGR